jgi:hypothetical protein
MVRETFQTRLSIESESAQCGIAKETSCEQSPDIAINTKSVQRALILNQFATASKKKTIVFHTKVETIWRSITWNMHTALGNGLIDDFNGEREEK